MLNVVCGSCSMKLPSRLKCVRLEFSAVILCAGMIVEAKEWVCIAPACRITQATLVWLDLGGFIIVIYVTALGRRDFFLLFFCCV